MTWSETSGNSDQYLSDDVSVNVCQPPVYPVVADGQAFVIDAEEVEDCRVEVVTIGLSFRGAPRPLVTPAV